MKHIFKKLHFGSSHDPNRSNETPVPSSSSSSSSPSCASDQRTPTLTSAQPPPSPPSSAPATSPAAGGPGTGTAVTDYFSSEEEFQVQLALAISASNSEAVVDDPESDQIRAATLLSLGRRNSGREREESGEAMSRRYWDYNVLDYDEKVVDGFYDIYGLSTGPVSQAKMPSLADLQTNLGDIDFEVVMVNRSIDPALEELQQVAHCIALGCPTDEIGLLVQRIADLVIEHMGGPVRDANDMLARWLERSTELKTSLHTSVLPIGCLNIGLSRHRALLFKVLADHVGLPCRLVKGSYYTGIDDDAINIIKSENEREFLVDLMAAPGTLIPADILSTKDASLNSYNPRLSQNLTSWTTHDSSINIPKMEPLHGKHKGATGKSTIEHGRIPDRRLIPEKPLFISSIPSARNGANPIGNSSNGNWNSSGAATQSYQVSSSVSATSSQQQGNRDASLSNDSVKEKLNMVPYARDNVDPGNLFADLNPFEMIKAGKTALQKKPSDYAVADEFQMHRDNVAVGPGRPPVPLMWKNRATCNEVPRTKQYDFVEGLFPRNNLEARGFHGSSLPSSTSTTSGEAQSEGSSHNSTSGSSPYINAPERREQEEGHKDRENFQSSRHKDRENFQSSRVGELKEYSENVNNRHDRRHRILDRNVLGNTSGSNDHEVLPAHASLSRIDPMLDDVAEWEIPWDDLIIGERIGLGSYGEVYHADWNGTEVAVKKFLDQDFSGDALDEFRSEVRIMRRLRHPNVVLFMGAVTRPPNLSIVTEFLPRGSLYRLLHRPNCQIDEKLRIKMALDVAKGMNCLHTSLPTVVHRDLKSPNLLVDKNWNVKVCDFGLSRLKHNTFLSSKSTAGTPEWMAPEVLRNEPSNEKCDVYSFGVILWELATLRMPWSGMNPMQVVGAVGFQNRRLEIPNELDPFVARIIWECWQSDPNLRPSFAQLTTALKPLQQLVISTQQQTDTQSSALLQGISVNSTP